MAEEQARPLKGWRTILVNGGILAAAAFLQFLAGVDLEKDLGLSPTVAVVALTVINGILRAVTTTGIGKANPIIAFLVFSFWLGAWPAAAQEPLESSEPPQVIQYHSFYDPCLDGFWENGQFWRKCPAESLLPGSSLVIAAADPGWPVAASPVAQTAQTTPFTFSLQLGAVFEPDATPGTSGDLTFLIGGGSTRSFTTVNARPIGEALSYSFRTGIERDFLVTSRATIALCGQAGIATSSETTSGIFSGCASLIVPVKAGFSFVLSGEAQNAPTDTGHWEPRVSAGFRYKFE